MGVEPTTQGVGELASAVWFKALLKAPQGAVTYGFQLDALSMPKVIKPMCIKASPEVSGW